MILSLKNADMPEDPEFQQKVESAMLTAKHHCDQNGLRLTTLREQILHIIWQSQSPIGAYNIMHQLAEISYRDQVAPPTVYRGLDFLLKHRLIHRVHSLNAFIGRRNPSAPSYEALLICSDCGFAQEVPNQSIQQAINLSANEHRFCVEQQVLEIIGRCDSCSHEAQAQ
jgi:Fur family zinc uptake transcriptional regulator